MPNNSTYLPASTPGSVDNILDFIQQCDEEEYNEGLNWYEEAHNAVKLLAEGYNLPMWTFCQVLAAISPLRNWSTNVTDAIHTIDAWQQLRFHERIPYLFGCGLAFPTGFRCFHKAWAILDGEAELQRKNAFKIYDFAQTVYRPFDYNLPPVDSHTGGGWTDEYHLTPGSYRICPSVYHRCQADHIIVAKELRIRPDQAQSAAWHKRRKLLPKRKPNAH